MLSPAGTVSHSPRGSSSPRASCGADISSTPSVARGLHSTRSGPSGEAMKSNEICPV